VAVFFYGSAALGRLLKLSGSTGLGLGKELMLPGAGDPRPPAMNYSIICMRMGLSWLAPLENPAL